ncbi:MAG: tetratricopeptide repeat protein [Chloroflexota bacterium]|nr:tetratricopeptide repeat protein [Chloroflexota bacterium]
MHAISTFGQWLKLHRQSLDLTQEALAEAVDYSVQTIRKIESGERRPSRQIAERLAHALSVPPSEHEAFILLARAARGGGDYPDFVDSLQAVLSASGDTPPLTTPDQSSLQQAPPASAPVSLPAEGVQDRFADRRLPAPPTPLIGREHVLAQARTLLWRTSTRLLTLTGPPGTGKTRLSLALAASLQDDFQDGVVFVPLATISDPAFVTVTLARILGVAETAGRPLLAALIEYLRDKQILLLLDNFEQVVEAASVVAEIMQSAPHVNILVTSRAALHIRGEKVLLVPPLGVPDTEQPQTRSDLLQIEAVVLFVARAQDVQSDFELTEENAPAVAAVCARLEGLPLAIELAAARMQLLSPSELLARLERQLALLTGGPRDVAARHKSLYGAIASSYDLLEEGERRLFRRLGVFVGGFTVEAAEAVAGAELDELAALVNESLLRRLSDVAGAVGGGSEIRFSMLLAIREYALEMLAQVSVAEDAVGSAQDEMSELANAREQHAAYYLALAETGHAVLYSVHSPEWLLRLDREHDNMRAALTWAGEQGDRGETALRLVRALSVFWYARGYLLEGRRWIEAALTQDQNQDQEDRAPELARLLALQEAMRFAQAQRDFEQCKVFAKEALSMAHALGHQKSIGAALSSLGVVAAEQGDYAGALAFLEEGLVTFRALDDARNIAVMMSNMAFLALHVGDYERAVQLSEESLEIHSARNDVSYICVSQINLGLAALHQGEYGRAIGLHQGALELAREIGNKRHIARALTHLGLSALLQGDSAQAEEYYKEGLPVMQDLGNSSGVASVLVGLGTLVARSALVDLREQELDVETLEALSGPRPTIHNTASALRQATRLISAASAQLVAERQRLTPVEQELYKHTLRSLRDAQSDAAFSVAWSEGQAMTMEDASACAQLV